MNVVLIWFINILAYFVLGFSLLEQLVIKKYQQKYGADWILDCEVYLTKTRRVDFFHQVRSADLLALSDQDLEQILRSDLYQICWDRVILEETIRKVERRLEALQESPADSKLKSLAKKLVSRQALTQEEVRQELEQTRQRLQQKELTEAKVQAELDKERKRLEARKLTPEQVEEEIDKARAELAQLQGRRGLAVQGDGDSPRWFVYLVELSNPDTFTDDPRATALERAEFNFILVFTPLAWHNCFQFYPGEINVQGYKVDVKKTKAAFTRLDYLREGIPVYRTTYYSALHELQLDESISAQAIVDYEKLALARMVCELKTEMSAAEKYLQAYSAQADFFRRQADDILGMYEEDTRPEDAYTTQVLQQAHDQKVGRKKRAWWAIGLGCAAIVVLTAIGGVLLW